MTDAPKHKGADKPTGLDLLRAPFPPNQISKLPKPTKGQTDEVRADFKKGIRCNICGGWHHPKVVHLDYVGHAALTDRLLDADPAWNWEPVAITDDGTPKYDQIGGMWIRLTVCGVTRLGYGHAEGKKGGDAIKELIGDALRNAAMRFGAALDLWHKGDLHAIAEADHVEEKADTTQDEAAWFKANLPGVKDADGINALLGRAKKAGRDVAGLVVARANELGLEFDADKREYVYLEQADDAEKSHDDAVRAEREVALPDDSIPYS